MFSIMKRASHFQVVCVCVTYDSAGTASVLNNETSESLPSCVCVTTRNIASHLHNCQCRTCCRVISSACVLALSDSLGGLLMERVGFVGQNRIIYITYGCIFGDSPAKNAIFTPYIHMALGMSDALPCV
jgi:hypothetical protein